MNCAYAKILTLVQEGDKAVGRKPIPGSDEGQWGEILNEYLDAAHNPDGTLKADSVSGATIQNGTIGLSQLDIPGTPTNGQVLSYDGSGLNWATVGSGGTVPDATSSVKGIVQLNGDLGGTAASPTVPGLAGKEPLITAGTTGQYLRGDKTWQTLDKAAVGLANVDNTPDTGKPVSAAAQTALNAKANDNAVVHLSGNETIAGTKNFTGTLQAGGQAVVATNDARLADQRVPTNSSVTPAKLSSANSPANGQVLSYNGAQFNWINPASGGGTTDQLISFSEEGTLQVGGGQGRFVFPVAATILGVTAVVGTAPTGASIIVDIHKNGTTIFTTQASRPTITAGTSTSSEATPNVTDVAAGQYLSVDIDQIGSTIAGADLTVVVRYQVAP